MTAALISDIHGNLEALEAVLADIETREVDAVYCLGDVVGYGPDPCACLHRAHDVCDLILRGNHEQYALGHVPVSQLSAVALQSAKWTQEQLGEREKEMITEFELSRQLADIMLVHASPRDPAAWRYVLGIREAALAFEVMEVDTGFFGHTHLPTVFTCDGDGRLRAWAGHSIDPEPGVRHLINVGSVGQPRDNDPRACYVTFETEPRSVTYHRIEYDIEMTQGKMRQAGLPDLLVDRLTVGK